MTDWTPFPIAGGAYSDESKPFSAQDTVNYLPVPAERSGTRSAAKLRDAPGLALHSAQMPVAPVRGLHDVEGLLLAAVGRRLYRVAADGTPSFIGSVPGTGRVTMAHNQIDNGFEVVVANGQAGYLYNTGTGAYGQITDPGFVGFRVVDSVDGYAAGVDPSGKFWYHSEVHDAGNYNTLDRYEAEALTDSIVGLIVSHREVFVQGSRSGQFFRNTGAATGTFQNANGTEMEVGLASAHASARLDNTVYWLGSDNIVYRLEGNQPRRVSTGPIEQAISQCDASRAYAFTFEDQGHKVFYLTCPDGYTFGYDVWTNEWHRRESYGLNRWRLSCLVKSGGQWIGGDFANGRLYRLDWHEKTEDGAPLDRRRRTGVLHNNHNVIGLEGIALEFDTGVSDVQPNRPAPPPEPVLPFAIAHWPLQDTGDTAEDRSGNGFTLTYEGAVTKSYAPVRAGAPNAARFIGGVAQIAPPDAPRALYVAGDRGDARSYSVCAWVTPEASGYGVVERDIVGVMDAGSTGACNWRLSLLDEGLRLTSGFHDTTNDYVAGSVPNNATSFVMATADKGDIRLYVNGSLAGAGSFNLQAAMTEGGGLKIGGGLEYPSAYKFGGTIGDVILFDSALTAAQVAYLHAHGPSVVQFKDP